MGGYQRLDNPDVDVSKHVLDFIEESFPLHIVIYGYSLYNIVMINTVNQFLHILSFTFLPFFFSLYIRYVTKFNFHIFCFNFSKFYLYYL